MEKTLKFLNELQQNNHKAWFDEHRGEYQKAKKEFEAILAKLIKGLQGFNIGFEGLSPKECIFRINRDIRFSKDKTPYKNNFGAYISQGGRKSPYAGYYLHIQAGGASFIGGGKYQPAAEDLAKIRQEIDYNSEEFRKIINAPAFKATFGELRGERLKTSPRGYSKDNPNLDLLRLKSFTVIKSVEDSMLRQEDFVEQVLGVFKQMKPLLDFLNRAVSD